MSYAMYEGTCIREKRLKYVQKKKRDLSMFKETYIRLVYVSVLTYSLMERGVLRFASPCAKYMQQFDLYA